MTNIELMEHWIKSSDDDYEAMMSLYKDKKYTWSLFIGHLVIEKLIKALHAKNNPQKPHALKIHNLVLLSENAEIPLSKEQKEILMEFNSFNINARYDDYKDRFRQKATRRIYTQSNRKNKGDEVMVKSKINVDILNSIEKYINVVNKHYKVNYIILFGSYAKGTNNESSDIDIAVVSSDFSDTLDDQVELMKLTIDIDLRIEPHAITIEEFNEVDTPFIDEIIQTGVELYAA